MSLKVQFTCSTIHICFDGLWFCSKFSNKIHFHYIVSIVSTLHFLVLYICIFLHTYYFTWKGVKDIFSRLWHHRVFRKQSAHASDSIRKLLVEEDGCLTWMLNGFESFNMFLRACNWSHSFSATLWIDVHYLWLLLGSIFALQPFSWSPALLFAPPQKCNKSH